LRRVHTCPSVRGALRWPKRELARMCKGVRMPDGRRPTPDQLRDHFMDELAQGHEVVPLGEPCEGFSFKTGCPGHDVPDAPAEEVHGG
jgi:hypothetical protein